MSCFNDKSSKYEHSCFPSFYLLEDLNFLNLSILILTHLHLMEQQKQIKLLNETSFFFELLIFSPFAKVKCFIIDVYWLNYSIFFSTTSDEN